MPARQSGRTREPACVRRARHHPGGPSPRAVRPASCCTSNARSNAVGAIQAYERYLTLVPNAGDAEKVRRRIGKLRDRR
ncbi:MAG: hypothetical protein QOC68_2645 [Solirubrobacteraceae bacterium]|jgi:regulator of sirC expression with transglutaminase-like and TPR domain|nr:hypothetical protein [Solirubrobacteraceae bacterium]